MSISEWKLIAEWFDGIISGWKRFIALIIVIFAMYFMDEGYAQHIAVAFGFFMGSMGFAAKRMSKKL